MDFKPIVLCIALGLILLVGCVSGPGGRAADFTLGKTFTISQNMTYLERTEGLTLLITSFTDSRCPSGVQCIWQGEVGVQLILTKLDTNNSSQVYLGEESIRKVNVLGYEVELISINFDKKEAQIKVTKIAENVCTMDALICPDGSGVGRNGPDCRFAPCPNCSCPGGFIQEGTTCNPGCYYSNPRCLIASVQCTPASSTNTGLANPASTNCIKNGGTLKIVDTNEGQVGMCTLPNGKVCEEWAYLRGDCTQ
jgi:putative hemolysin